MASSLSRPSLPFKWILISVVTLFIVFAAELYFSARLESQTFDEPAHMFAGYSYWLHSDFGVNPEHPPFVKLVATLPLLLSKPTYPQIPPIHFRAASAFGGMIMMLAPGADANLAHARVAVSIFSFILGVLVFLAAREMFGDLAALLALLLFVFDPLILAHAPLLGTDMGATCCIFASVYAFYRYAKRQSILRLILCCVAAGLALAAKHSAILLFPMLVLLGVFEAFFDQNDSEPLTFAFPPPRLWLKMASDFAIIAVSAVVILWAFYGFRYAARPGGQQIVPAPADYVNDLHHPIEANAIRFAEIHHLLPESYLFGFTDVTILARDGRPMYLFGKIYPQGKWFYFPSAFIIKMTIGFMALLLLVFFERRLWLKEMRRELVFLVFPVLVFFGSAMTAKVDIGIRHILPIMPFLIVLAAGAATALALRSRPWAWAVAILVLLHVGSSLHASPNYLPYSNEAFGGPFKTWRVLHDSNVGWGGGLKALHTSLAERNITQCWLAYSALPDPGHFQIPCKRLPTFFSSISDQGQQQPVPAQIDGPVFISSEELAGSFWGPPELDPYGQFMRLDPSHAIGGEILEFDGSFDIPRVASVSESVVSTGLLRQGKIDQALDHAEKAVTLDPQSMGAHEALSAAYAAQHQDDAAEREFQTALALYHAVDPAFVYILTPPGAPLAHR